MDILVYEDNIEKDTQIVAAIDWKYFAKEVKRKPEDYVFILSSDEWNKFMELNKQIFAGFKGKDNEIKDENINRYPGIYTIAVVGLEPDFVKRYKIGSIKPEILGSSHAAFFIDRSTNDVERSNAVLKRIMDYKANTTREDNKRN